VDFVVHEDRLTRFKYGMLHVTPKVPVSRTGNYKVEGPIQHIPMPMDSPKQYYIQQMGATKRSIPAESPNSHHT
jgi:hypothetical protein